jgi:lipopolysaccharide biosynthesis regulator YciM
MKKIMKLGSIALLSIILLYSALSIKRNYFWEREYTLSSDAAEKSPDKLRVHIMLGRAYMDEKRYDDAIEEFKKVTKFDSFVNNLSEYDSMVLSHLNLGLIYQIKRHG